MEKINLGELHIMTNKNLADLDLYERHEILSEIGMLADEDNVGQPERPYSEWSEEDFETVLALFESWPYSDASAPEFEHLANAFEQHFNPTILQDNDIKAILEHTAQALSAAGKEAFDADAPDVVLDFVSSPEAKGYYGGLRPDGKIQINSDKLNDMRVKGSTFEGAESFIELVSHEATHLFQNYCDDTCDVETEDLRLSIRVSMMFYEATDGAKKAGHRELYWQHPMEVQARDVAERLTSKISEQNPAPSVTEDNAFDL